MKLTKSKLKQIIKEELFKESEEKSEAELACERKAADRGVPMGFNPSTGKCEVLNEYSARGGLSEGGELQNTAKGAAASLLDTAKSMEQAPSHEPASMYAQEVAKQANLIMDMLVNMEPRT